MSSHKNQKWIVITACVAGTLMEATQAIAAAPMAVALRAGTPGVGLDLDIGLLDRLSARLGYSGFDLNRTVNQTDVTYNGKLKISDASLLFDWYAFGGGFHLTAGGVGGGVTVDITGQPTSGTYTINNTTYTSDQLGSLNGRLKFGNSVAPYVGLGWGDAVSGGHLHFLFDLGAIYGGTPKVTLNAVCGPAAPANSATCTQIQSNVDVERQKLQSDVTLVKWYPVLNLGLAYRF